MNTELYITKIFLSDKELYDKYSHYVLTDYFKDNYKELYTINKLLEDYYKKYESNIDEFESWFYVSLPRIKDKEAEVYKEMFSLIKETAINKELVIDIVEQIKKKEQVNNIVLNGISYLEGNLDYENYINDINQFLESKDIGVEYNFHNLDASDILKSTIMSYGLRWRLKTMNMMLGSIRKGNFGFVFARPETGKTTFLASELTFMLDQVERPIIWFNNEQEENEVALRVYLAYFGVTKDQFKENYTEFNNKFPKDKFKLVDLEKHAYRKKDIENIMKELNPSLVVFDQIDKIKGFKHEEHRLDMQYKAIYQWARELAKQYCPVIGVCQAGGTGEGKRNLTMDDVDSSKTAKQGEADWILGIGKTNDPEPNTIRHLHLSKNKLAGDPDSISTLRHGSQEVIIVPEIARYVDLFQGD